MIVSIIIPLIAEEKFPLKIGKIITYIIFSLCLGFKLIIFVLLIILYIINYDYSNESFNNIGPFNNYTDEIFKMTLIIFYFTSNLS